jgi:hypothetical protein
VIPHLWPVLLLAQVLLLLPSAGAAELPCWLRCCACGAWWHLLHLQIQLLEHCILLPQLSSTVSSLLTQNN